MKKEYLIILSILVGSIILATATYIEKCKKLQDLKIWAINIYLYIYQ